MCRNAPSALMAMQIQKIVSARFPSSKSSVRPSMAGIVKSRRWELNPRPTDYESVALPLSYSGSEQEHGGLRGEKQLNFQILCGSGCRTKKLRMSGRPLFFCLAECLVTRHYL